MTIHSLADTRNNAELIRDYVAPIWFEDHWTILDSTHNAGKFWKLWQPEHLVRVDIDPLHRDHIDLLGDGTRLPFADDTFDATVTDGPYKLNGRPTDSVDLPYGVHKWQGRTERHTLLVGLLIEAARVTRPEGIVTAKSMPQVNGGRRWFQHRILSDAAEAIGMALVDEYLMPSGRKQPERSSCTECGAALMRRSDGQWGRVVSKQASDTEKAAAFVCEGTDVPHVPGEPTPQQHSESNYSVMSIFRLPARALNLPDPSAEPTLFDDDPALCPHCNGALP